MQDSYKLSLYRHVKMGFLLLILVQGLHSIEEYLNKLWTVLAPARFLAGLVSKNLALGFLLINIGLFLIGLFCWFITTRQNIISHPRLIWLWILIETLNGIGHPLLALNQGSYFPGLITAPILLILSFYLARQLLIYNRNY